ncbi:unnamed protein product, partial [Oikopleura dioica]
LRQPQKSTRLGLSPLRRKRKISHGNSASRKNQGRIRRFRDYRRSFKSSNSRPCRFHKSRQEYSQAILARIVVSPGFRNEAKNWQL